jgi:hypothetical protein
MLLASFLVTSQLLTDGLFSAAKKLKEAFVLHGFVNTKKIHIAEFVTLKSKCSPHQILVTNTFALSSLSSALTAMSLYLLQPTLAHHAPCTGAKTNVALFAMENFLTGMKTLAPSVQGNIAKSTSQNASVLESVVTISKDIPFV